MGRGGGGGKGERRNDVLECDVVVDVFENHLLLRPCFFEFPHFRWKVACTYTCNLGYCRYSTWPAGEMGVIALIDFD